MKLLLMKLVQLFPPDVDITGTT